MRELPTARVGMPRGKVLLAADRHIPEDVVGAPVFHCIQLAREGTLKVPDVHVSSGGEPTCGAAPVHGEQTRPGAPRAPPGTEGCPIAGLGARAAPRQSILPTRTHHTFRLRRRPLHPPAGRLLRWATRLRESTFHPHRQSSDGPGGGGGVFGPAAPGLRRGPFVLRADQPRRFFPWEVAQAYHDLRERPDERRPQHGRIFRLCPGAL